MGYVVKRIGRFQIIEGVGRYGGYWCAWARNEARWFNSVTDAEEHAYLSIG